MRRISWPTLARAQDAAGVVEPTPRRCLIGAARRHSQQKFLHQIDEQADGRPAIFDLLGRQAQSGQKCASMDRSSSLPSWSPAWSRTAVAEAKPLSFVSTWATSRPRPSFALIRRLFEILDNLIDNAIKYTGPGGSRARMPRKGLREVTDTGIGIPRDDRASSNTYRVDEARTANSAAGAGALDRQAGSFAGGNLGQQPDQRGAPGSPSDFHGLNVQQSRPTYMKETKGSAGLLGCQNHQTTTHTTSNLTQSEFR